MVELKTGDISTDLAYYLTQSEQIPSALLLDVCIDEQGKVEQSGGLLVQSLPGAPEHAIQIMHEGLQRINNLNELLKHGYSAEEMVHIVFSGELKEVANTPVDFFCRCSLDRFKAALLTLGIEEIQSMRQENQRELVCRYCNTHYTLSDNDFTELLSTLQAKNN